MRRVPFVVMSFAFLLFIGCSSNKSETTEATGEKSADTVAATEKKGAWELLDMSLSAPIRASYDAFTRGDIDGLTANYADNVRFFWSGGDSLIGKQAVKDYYTGRWNLIDSLAISNHIFLPVQMNEVQSEFAPTGKWIAHWAMVNVKYKNKKRVIFWIHQVNHLNDAGKIDQSTQFIDRAPLMAATKGLAAK